MFLFDKRGKDVALANLESAFGNSRTAAEKRRIAVGSYRTFARTMLELFWSPNLSESVKQNIAHVEGIEDSCHKDRRQAVVYLCLHYSNFEWLSQFSAYSVGNVRSSPSDSKIRSLAAFSTVCAAVQDTV